METEHKRWEHVWELFHEAVGKGSGDRSEYLNHACATDPGLRRELESLLASHDSRENLLDSPSLFDPLLIGSDWSDAPVGERIGPYRISSVIGEGGMGIVYAAEQEEPIRRPVALKLIKPGLETRRVLARFESERQTLALMDHPNIARIYDAGTTVQGHPYFVMELVEGTSITEYCDREGFSLGRRLQLFIQVCLAVQHAHQRGIIHRDLKPSNILVKGQKGQPLPKVIDFGVAKALHPSLLDGTTSHTQNLAMIGTPEYMSPEQARRQDDIDTRTDVYSLGMLLFKLLAGVSPFGVGLRQCRDYFEMIDLVQKQEVPRPTTALEASDSNLVEISAARGTDPVSLRRRLKGELEWIILKAVDKDRQKRYSTVLELSTDLERYLDHQPVSAGAQGTSYRALKFVQRHRFGVAAALLLVLLLAAFSVVVSLQSYRLSTALKTAERQKQRAERVSAFLVELFRASDPYSNPGKTVTLEEIVDKGAARISMELAGEPEVQAALLETLGGVYRSLGHNQRAAPLLEKALAIRRRLHGEDNVEVADSLLELGVLRQYQGQRQEAEQLLREALKLHLRHLGEHHSQVVRDLLFLGSLLRSKGKMVEAEETLRRALRLDQGLDSLPTRKAEILEQLGTVLHREARFPEAEQCYTRSLQIREASAPNNPSTASTMTNAGAMYLDWGKFDKAEPLLRKALELHVKFLGENHHSSINDMSNLAYLLHQKGAYKEAEKLYQRALALTRKNMGENSSTYVINVNNLGLLLYDMGKLGEARDLFRQNLPRQERVWGKNHPNVAYALNNLARVLEAMHQDAEAERLYRQGLKLRRKTLPAGHPAISGSLTDLARLRLKRGDAAEAESMLRESLQIRRRSYPETDWRTAQTENLLGACLAAQKKDKEAEPLLVNGLDGLERQRPRRLETRRALHRVIDFYRHRGDTAKVARYSRLLAH